MNRQTVKQIRREMRELIARDIATGFEAPADIVTSVVDLFASDYPDTPAASLREMAEELVTRAIQEHVEAQAKWPAATDCDRLDRAFAELEEKGILCRQNFSDCLSGGHDAMQKEVAGAREQGRDIRGYTFFHAQDTDAVIESGAVFLAFGAVPASDEHVALAVLSTLVESEDGSIPADHEQPVRFKQAVITQWREANPSCPVPTTVAEALRVVAGMVRNAPPLVRLSWMNMSPEHELAVFRVANEIVDTLRRHGLDARWEGRSECRIEVPMDWKRRR